MPFTVTVTDISFEDKDFQAIYTLNHDGKTFKMNFSNVNDSNAWIEYICEKHNAKCIDERIECTEDNFDEWLKKATHVNFNKDGANFSLRSSDGNMIFFYFSDQQTCNKYCDEHMKFYVKK